VTSRGTWEPGLCLWVRGNQRYLVTPTQKHSIYTYTVADTTHTKTYTLRHGLIHKHTVYTQTNTHAYTHTPPHTPPHPHTQISPVVCKSFSPAIGALLGAHR